MVRNFGFDYFFSGEPLHKTLPITLDWKLEQTKHCMKDVFPFKTGQSTYSCFIFFNIFGLTPLSLSFPLSSIIPEALS